MRWRPRAITTLLALACAWVAACGSKGGHNTTTIITQSAFPQGFLPVLLSGSGGSGDVAFRPDGDLFAVDGGSDVTTVSRANGTVAVFAHVSGASLLSITAGAGSDGRLFAGDDAGRIWAIAADGSSASVLVDTGTQSITGLAFAPSGFGDSGGSLIAAAGTSGLLRITTEPPAFSTLANPPASAPHDRYVDLAFSGTTLFAIDATHAEIDTVNPDGSVATFQGGFVAPMGIAVESGASEIYVADAGDDVLRTVPVAGGAPTKRAAYDFDTTANGIAFDGFGAIAFVTSDPHAIGGADLPRIDPANTNFGLLFVGPTVGYGDLEFDRLGGFVLVGNAPAGTTRNFLFRAGRDGIPTSLDSPIGTGEDLFGVAVDPSDQAIYVSTSLGNVYKRDADGTVSLLASVSSRPLLGLELVPKKRFDPFAFDPYSGQLVATSDDGHVFVIDPPSATSNRITTSPIGTHLSDLVFSADGNLYAVDNNGNASRILKVAPNGTASIVTASAQLGQPDGIEIDEGGKRLLVTSLTAGGEQLLSVDLRPAPRLGTVTALANIDFDDGFFPTGIVFDRLATLVHRQGDNSTSLHALSLPLPLP